ncbi:hypothetical protein WH96_14090 [Kiloniella spongiae]|uniref:DUF6468 domain-containing protein n=1 Tax=Kiloniella spongiae TaxID=1489064 RepID=A0A0H2MD43_9PROT|nr:DUF6468 domain-containing protein [Kiloniella spongiae]KLN60298.1 hypothetical protein WH96_14090 [Kiloniella spongiae]
MLDISSIELGFNILVAILLVATIVYAVILNKKLDALREAKAEMEGLIVSFAETTAKAEKSLAEFKIHASDTGSGLKENTVKADGILSDLSYLVDRAEVVADRLEEDLGLARQKSPETVLPKGVKSGDVKKDKAKLAHKDGEAKKDLSPAAEDLLKTLKGMR